MACCTALHSHRKIQIQKIFTVFRCQSELDDTNGDFKGTAVRDLNLIVLIEKKTSEFLKI